MKRKSKFKVLEGVTIVRVEEPRTNTVVLYDSEGSSFTITVEDKIANGIYSGIEMLFIQKEAKKQSKPPK